MENFGEVEGNDSVFGEVAGGLTWEMPVESLMVTEEFGVRGKIEWSLKVLIHSFCFSQF